MILKSIDYEGDEIIKIVDTREKAQEFCDLKNSSTIIARYDYQEMDVE